MDEQKMLRMLAKEMVSIMKEQDGDAGDLHTKAPSAYGTAQLLHGTAGTWQTPGLERDIVTTHVQPTGIAEALPWFPSVYEQPYYGVLTGFSGDIGSEPANPCDDAPTGYHKSCNLTAQFGRLGRDTETIEVDKIILRKNRADHTDLVLRGSVLGMGGQLQPQNLSETDILNLVVASEMVNVGVNAQNKLMKHIWTGSPSNNNAGGGYKEFPGLDNQVNTGHVDAQTGTACPSVDSLILDFNYNNVDGSGSLDIVTYLQMGERYVRQLASDTGMDPAEWVIVMRKDLWFELTEIWPCAYGTNRCASGVMGDNSRIMIDGRESVAMRDQMRRDMRLEINGTSYRVIVDDGVYEQTNTNDANVPAGSFASSIYFLPLRVTGNFPVLYFEHLDYRQAQAETRFLNNMQRFWTDNGRFMWAYEDTGGFCFKLKAKTEMRVVLRTPHLAFKLQNVLYSPLRHYRDADFDSPYYVDGGVSLRTSAAINAVWL